MVFVAIRVGLVEFRKRCRRIDWRLNALGYGLHVLAVFVIWRGEYELGGTIFAMGTSHLAAARWHKVVGKDFARHDPERPGAVEPFRDKPEV